MAHGRWSVGAALLAALLAGAACEEKSAEKKPEGAKADAGPPKASGVDKNLAEAVAAVAGGAAPGASAGPPETGVFAAGIADREMRLGEAPKLTLGGKGSAPTVTFARALLKQRSQGRVQVAVQMGPRSAMPTVDLTIAIEPAVASSEGAVPGPGEVTVKVTAAKPASEQPGELPPGLGQQIAKLQGSRLRYAVLPSGVGKLVAVEYAKGADEQLGQIVRSASDALALAFLPYPTEPVGVGAFWMITSRDMFAGLDVVTYRMVKLEGVEADAATVSVNTKRYVAGGQMAFPGLPPHQMNEFQGTTTGRMTVAPADPSRFEGEANDVILAGLLPLGGQGPQAQRLGLQLQVRTKFAAGGR